MLRAIQFKDQLRALVLQLFPGWTLVPPQDNLPGFVFPAVFCLAALTFINVDFFLCFPDFLFHALLLLLTIVPAHGFKVRFQLMLSFPYRCQRK
ncbi:MAG: hypothetical protein ACLSA6_04720 [Holdemania massiliensis]